MFTVEMLPAAEGDCLWIEYGDDPEAPNRILIDTGTAGTYRGLARRIKSLPESQRRFELFVVTHIDSDHIGSAPRLLEKRPFGVQFDEVWFNDWRHLPEPRDKMGERQAGLLSEQFDAQGMPWNTAFEKQAVMVPAEGPLPERTLPGGMKLTLLSPYEDQLAALVPRWSKYLEGLRLKAEAEAQKAADHLGEVLNIDALAQTPFVEDKKEPNGSSIALLAEYQGQRVLLGADAFPSVIERSIGRLLGEDSDARLKLAAFKLCHHGSGHNTSPSLAKRIDAASWLVSTSGSRHNHPDPESIARLLAQRPNGRNTRILFNYSSEFNKGWKDPLLAKHHHYTALFPPDKTQGMVWSADEARSS